MPFFLSFVRCDSSPQSSPVSASPTAPPHPILTTSSLLHGLKKIEKERVTDLNGIEVRVGNPIENQGCAYEVLKLYNSHKGTGKATIQRPTAGPLRPNCSYDGQTQKYNMKLRAGKGVSLEELKSTSYAGEPNILMQEDI
ncbi:hypothetical protein P8452_25776 [Trifolium repens]|nr:hypothetical protein P8452_25776 [Trifolium repens]